MAVVGATASTGGGALVVVVVSTAGVVVCCATVVVVVDVVGSSMAAVVVVSSEDPQATAIKAMAEARMRIRFTAPLLVAHSNLGTSGFAEASFQWVQV